MLNYCLALPMTFDFQHVQSLFLSHLLLAHMVVPPIYFCGYSSSSKFLLEFVSTKQSFLGKFHMCSYCKTALGNYWFIQLQLIYCRLILGEFHMYSQHKTALGNYWLIQLQLIYCRVKCMNKLQVQVLIRDTGQYIGKGQSLFELGFLGF